MQQFVLIIVQDEGDKPGATRDDYQHYPSLLYSDSKDFNQGDLEPGWVRDERLVTTELNPQLSGHLPAQLLDSVGLTHEA